ncbi:hypothetical protein [Candidatus Palauibacter sp.]|uniref:hypothetical protein n=1 Tax=Candidatus Palauibacter sp. TaxID=3101350 RepID=UPI003B52DAD6
MAGIPSASRVGLAVLALLSLNACEVRDAEADSPLDWTFTPTLRLGSTSGPDALYGVDDHSITLGPEGTFVVLDKGNYRVLTFDPRGTLVGEFGSQGDGPAAFGYPVAILGPRNDTIRVLDGPSSSYKVFDSGGEFLGQESVDRIFELRNQQRLVEGGTVIMRGVGYRSVGSPVRDRLLLVRGPADTLALATLEKRARADFSVPECRVLSMPMSPLFDPTVVWDARGEVVAVNDQPEYVIQIYEGETSSRSLERPIAPAAVSREDARGRISGGRVLVVAGQRCRIDPEEELETRGFEERRQVVSAIRVDGDGWVWVRRHAAPLSGPDRLVTDVFDPEGAYRGTLPEGSPWPATFTADGRVIALETDELEIQSFVVYSVGRDGG